MRPPLIQWVLMGRGRRLGAFHVKSRPRKILIEVIECGMPHADGGGPWRCGPFELTAGGAPRAVQHCASGAVKGKPGAVNSTWSEVRGRARSGRTSQVWHSICPLLLCIIWVPHLMDHALVWPGGAGGARRGGRARPWKCPAWRHRRRGYGAHSPTHPEWVIEAGGGEPGGDYR